jgi:hypothetical protein
LVTSLLNLSKANSSTSFANSSLTCQIDSRLHVSSQECFGQSSILDSISHLSSQFLQVSAQVHDSIQDTIFTLVIPSHTNQVLDIQIRVSLHTLPILFQQFLNDGSLFFNNLVCQ